MRHWLRIAVAAAAVTGGAGRARAQAPGATAAPDADDVEVPSSPAAPAAAPAPGEATATPAASPPAPAAAPSASTADTEAREARAALAARVSALEAALAASAERDRARERDRAPALPGAAVNGEAAARPGAEADGLGALVLPAPGFLLSGYAQGQAVTSRASQDQLQQGGAYFNQDQFVLRRARLRADRRWRHAALALELDGNTNGGLAFGVRRAEASLVWDGGAPANPLAVLTVGMFYVPFGAELSGSARTRPFMERTAASAALFPGQADVGARLAGGWRFLRYAVALVNGEPIAEGAAAASRFRGDPNAAKDLVARLGVDVPAAPTLRIAGGVSLLEGKGFHAGTDATKGGTIWVDADENGKIGLGEVTPVPGTAATPSANFRRWAVGADLRVGVRTPLGLTQVFGEAVVASNLDRGLYVADPVATGLDVRELGFSAALVQDVLGRAVAGFRFDVYDPNADLFDSRAGRLLPASQRITTLSPMAGARFGDRAQLTLQYDHIIDGLARDAQGVPADLRNDQLTLRLQVDL